MISFDGLVDGAELGLSGIRIELLVKALTEPAGRLKYAERLQCVPLVKLVHVRAEAADFLLHDRLPRPQLLEDRQHLCLGCRVESMDRELALPIVDGVYLPQVLLKPRLQLLLEEVQAGVAVELDAQIVLPLLIGLEQQRAVLAVEDD